MRCKEKPKKKRKKSIWAITVLIAHIVGFFSSIDAIMETRTSQGAIAWVISLNTCPMIAVPAYWVLGRSKFEGYVTARQLADDNYDVKIAEIRKAYAPYLTPESEITNAGRAAQSLADVPFLRGNDVELLINGNATFDSIADGIAAAKEYVLFQFYIVHDDELGRRMKDALISKAQEGLRVYFLYDEVGCLDLPEAFLQELRDAGVKVNAFNTRQGKSNRFQINFRNHRKIVVVDGNTTWIGGHNVGDEYVGKSQKFPNWRDTHMKVTGPAALAAQLSVCEDWNWAANELISDLNWTPIPPEDSNKKVMIVPTGPADELETATLMFLHAINSAEKRIWIASPYFVPDGTIINALQLAGLRGVDVRILIPDVPDHMLVYLAAFSYVKEASKTGVEIYRYTDGFLHQKVMLIDDHIATVGTANFDNRSFRLNFEVTAMVADETFAKEVEAMLIHDMENSRKMTSADIDDQSWWFRFKVRAARLTSPIQ